jgi:hypothetical protein
MGLSRRTFSKEFKEGAVRRFELAASFTPRRPSRVIATDRFFPSDPTTAYQGTRTGPGG